MDCAFSFSENSIILCTGACITRGVNKKKRVQKTIATPIASIQYYSKFIDMLPRCHIQTKG